MAKKRIKDYMTSAKKTGIGIILPTVAFALITSYFNLLDRLTNDVYKRIDKNTYITAKFNHLPSYEREPFNHSNPLFRPAIEATIHNNSGKITFIDYEGYDFRETFSSSQKKYGIDQIIFNGEKDEEEITINIKTINKVRKIAKNVFDAIRSDYFRYVGNRIADIGKEKEQKLLEEKNKYLKNKKTIESFL